MSNPTAPLIPTTPQTWTDSIRGKAYSELYDAIKDRPIVAWFSDQKRAVHTLHKMTGRVGDNHWSALGHNYDDETEVLAFDATELHKALRYLTKENGWTLCEFAKGRDFHEAVLAYLGN